VRTTCTPIFRSISSAPRSAATTGKRPPGLTWRQRYWHIGLRTTFRIRSLHSGCSLKLPTGAGWTGLARSKRQSGNCKSDNAGSRPSSRRKCPESGRAAARGEGSNQSRASRGANVTGPPASFGLRLVRRRHRLADRGDDLRRRRDDERDPAMQAWGPPPVVPCPPPQATRSTEAAISRTATRSRMSAVASEVCQLNTRTMDSPAMCPRRLAQSFGHRLRESRPIIKTMTQVQRSDPGMAESWSALGASFIGYRQVRRMVRTLQWRGSSS
jgi:hypothetical protein